MRTVATVLFYRFARLMVSLVLLIWTRKQVVGLENVPKQGPVDRKSVV